MKEEYRYTLKDIKMWKKKHKKYKEVDEEYFREVEVDFMEKVLDLKILCKTR